MGRGRALRRPRALDRLLSSASIVRLFVVLMFAQTSMLKPSFSSMCSYLVVNAPGSVWCAADTAQASGSKRACDAPFTPSRIKRERIRIVIGR